MTLGACLETVVRPKFRRSKNRHGTFNLDEPNGMVVGVRDLRSGAVVVRMEEAAKWPMLIDGCWTKTCDYMIFNPDGRNGRVLLVELKKTVPTGDRACEQLRRSLPLLRYFLEVCRIHCGYNEKGLAVRYAMVAEKSSVRLAKQQVRRTRTLQFVVPHHEIDVAIHIVGRNVRFGQLWVK